MLIEILKQPDGSGLLRCTRDDDSVTWQKQARHAGYFALHDLTHFAVESTLGCESGFFGLVAQGWDIAETTGKGVRGPLPPEAIEVEKIVGLLDTERASGTLMYVQEFNQLAPRTLTQAELDAIRKLRAELFEKWSAVKAGEALKLTFRASRPVSS
ncbi:MAG TPA: hypothetical protein VE783_02455 [Candidatus Limnocylindrales bacterium]|nr:hypothetical protein [Candidatus Limnocylindrales bacterium]